VERGPQIFSTSFLQVASSLGGLRSAKYSTQNRLEALKTVFGKERLRDLAKKVLVATFKLDSALGPQANTTTTPSWKGKFFHNYPGPGSDEDQLALDVALRTSAAPVYFPIYEGYIDGGLIANNPSVCALAQALHPNGASKLLEEVVLISLGTGSSPSVLNSMDGDWGLLEWKTNLLSIPLFGNEDVGDFQCSQILRDRYMRLQPDLASPIGLDAIDQIGKLQAIGQNVAIDHLLSFIDSKWN
jgi:patatin-like phospholipase/acyl hydrolase